MRPLRIDVMLALIATGALLASGLSIGTAPMYFGPSGNPGSATHGSVHPASVAEHAMQAARAALIAHPLATSSINLTGETGWQQASPAQADAAIAYDPAGPYVVLYGDGGAVANFSRTTWLFQNDSWTVLRTNGSPPGLYGPSLAYDPSVGGVVLFGGATEAASGALLRSNQTWLLSGANWTLLSTAQSPPARYFGQMVYDASAGYLVLFGGDELTHVANDTWTFANGSWSPVATAPAPPVIFFQGAGEDFAYDSTDGYVVLITINATWRLIHGAWNETSPNSMPLGIVSSTLFDDPALHGVLMVDGCCNGTNGYYPELWAYAAGNWSVVASGPSPEPAQYSAPLGVYENISHQALLYTGAGFQLNGTGADATTWLYANSTWEALNLTNNTYNRFAGAIAYDPSKGGDLLFGGWVSGVTTPNSFNAADTWLYQNGTWNQQTLSKSPAGRSVAAMTYDAADAYVLLFGGVSYSAGPYGDTWEYANSTWSQLSPRSSPGSRFGAAMTYDAADGYVLLFGGAGAGNSRFNDTWTYVSGSWTNITSKLATSPSPRAGAGMVYDAQLGCVVLFGGGDGKSLLNDTWEFVKGAWKNVTLAAGSAPPPRDDPGFAYDAAAGYAVLSGGGNWFGRNSYFGPSQTFGGTWIFDNGSWYPLALMNAPTGAANPMSAYDGALGTIVTYGGDGAPPITWLWAGLPSLQGGTLAASPGVGEKGQVLTVSATISGAVGPLSYSWTGLPTGCAAANVESLHCTPTVTGNFSVRLNVTDASSDSNLSLGPLDVPIVDALSVASPTVSPARIDLGAAVTFAVRASAGAPPYAYAWKNLPSGCVAADAANLTCTPSAQGSYSVSVDVTDSSHIAQTVGPVQLAVAGTLGGGLAAARTTLDLGENLSLNAAVSGGTSPFGYNWSGLPTGCLAADQPALECAPASTGSWNVSAVVSDSAGRNETLGPLLVTVVPALKVTTFRATPSALDLGMEVNFSAMSLGGVPSIAWSYSDLPAGCISAAAASLSCTPSQAGTSNVTVVATDSTGASSEAIVEVSVNAALSAGSLVAAPASPEVGAPMALSVPASGGTTPLVWAYSGLPNGCASVDEPTLACTPTSAGPSTVTVMVSDAAGASVLRSLTFTVGPALAVSALSVTPSAPIVGMSVTLKVTWSGGTAPVTVAYAGLWSDCTASTGATTTCPASTPGTFHVKATATDALGESGAASVVVNVAPTPLAIVGFTAGPSTIPYGGTTDLNLSLRGGAGPFTITYSDLPTGCISQNTSALACTPTEAGKFSIGVRASDPFGQVETANLTLQVLPAPPPPAHSSPASGPPWLGIGLGIAIALALVGALLWALRRRQPPRIENPDGPELGDGLPTAMPEGGPAGA